MYEFDFARFRTVPGLACKAVVKNREKNRSFKWYRCVINGRRKYTRRNIPLYLSICKSK